MDTESSKRILRDMYFAEIRSLLPAVLALSPHILLLLWHTIAIFDNFYFLCIVNVRVEKLSVRLL